jgi:hypothetical protein
MTRHVIWDTLTWLELSWIIVCLFGAVAALWLCGDLMHDGWDVYRTKVNGTKRAAVRLGIAITAAFVWTLGWFVALGVVAGTQPQPPFITPGQWALTLGLYSTAFVLDGVCLYWRISRHRRINVPGVPRELHG